MSAIAQSVAGTTREKDKPKPPSGWEQLKHLIPYMTRYKGMVALGLLSLTLMGIVGALPQLIIGSVVDLLKGSPQPLATLSGVSRSALHPLFALYAPLNRHALGLYCSILLGAMLLKGFLSFWSRWILIGISREIEYDLRNDLLARLVRLEPEFYVRNRTGDLMSRVTNDLNAVRMVLGPGIMYSATTFATMVLAIYFMAKLSLALTLWVLIPVPVVVIAVRYFGQIIHRLSEEIQASLGVLSTRAQENLTGIRVIRAYVQEKPQIASFDEANRDYVNQNIKLIGSWSLFFPALSSLIGITVVILLGAGGMEVIDRRVSLGTFSAFYAFLIQLIFPMIAIGWVTNIFQRGAASMGRLRYILTAEPNISDANVSPSPQQALAGGNGASPLSAQAAPAPAGAESPIRGEIEFRHLTFAYPTSGNGSGNIDVLHDINLHVPAGSTLAIVGPTGSGKSTIAALIARLWEAPPGTLLIDGRPIREYPLAELRRAIGYVPQDTFLFSETLRENIAFGVSEAADEHILGAAELASISGEIQSFPQRLDTMVGERGVTLSGGQKQRTALARAILRQPKILILDDSLSSVDTDTEERILRGLRDVMKQRTTVLVSHRVSTVKGADQIVVMRDGRIVEQGSHDELLALDGYYADLHRKQLLEEELAARE
ncbi:MAG: ABC transporter ATP-binding protein [Candidatus Acidiferrales bacterium]|jgi:ATP-binding cassette subfamily B protein